MSRVLFAGGGTGGHLYPALALAAALRATRPGTAVHFVGARRGVEARVLPQRGEPYTLLPFEPLYRDRVWRNWRLAVGTATAFFGLARLFSRLRPRLVVGTGGYASAPACFFALAVGVPVAVQEQNSWPGATTRVVSRFAQQVHLGFPEARRHLSPGRRTEVHALGNPIQPPDALLDRAASRVHFGLRPDTTVVLVVGGSQGALPVNEALLEAIAAAVRAGSRPAGLEVLWSTGPAHHAGIAARLAELGVTSWVHAVGYIDDMPRALAAADVALSRAGAMATAELLAWRVPMLLIPLPTAAADHQRHNARALQVAGAAIVVDPGELQADRLWAEVTRLVQDSAMRSRMARAAAARAQPDAASRIAAHLVRLLEAA